MSANRRHRAGLPFQRAIPSTAFRRFCIGLGATRIIRIPFFGVHNLFSGYFLCLSERLLFGLWMAITATYRELGHKLSPLGLITAGTWGGHVDCIYSVGTEYRRPLFLFFSLYYKRRRSNAPRSAEIRDRVRFYFPFTLILLGKTTRRLDWKIPHMRFSVGHGPYHTLASTIAIPFDLGFFFVLWMTLRP